jgi:hypothetical protein
MSNGRLRETFESIGGCLLSIFFLALPLVLLVALLKSIGWIARVVLPIFGWISGIALLLVPVLLLISIARSLRGWAGLGIVLASYAVGFSLWVWALVIAFVMAGLFWMIVGLVFAGVGVVFVAIVASAIHGEWSVFIQLIVGVVVVYFLRVIGNVLIERSEPKEEYPPPAPPVFDNDSLIE